MNILDITNEDIARLQENKIVFGLMDERDQEILKFVGGKNAEVYTRCGFSIFCKDYDFYKDNVYRIISGYHLPAPTEAEIIAYLKASEVPPSQWHPAAQEWAKRHDGELIFEAVYKDQTGVTKIIACNKIIDCMSPCHVPHRLRADYGKVKEPIIAQPCYRSSDVSYGPFTLEPEVCVCGTNPLLDETNVQINFKTMTVQCFCMACGKEIKVK